MGFVRSWLKHWCVLAAGASLLCASPGVVYARDVVLARSVNDLPREFIPFDIAQHPKVDYGALATRPEFAGFLESLPKLISSLTAEGDPPGRTFVLVSSGLTGEAYTQFVTRPDGSRDQMIVLDLGLLNLLESEGELAAVIAHELAHADTVIRGDTVQHSFWARVGENEADLRGTFERLERAGHPADVMLQLLRRLQARFGVGAGYTHTATGSRIDMVASVAVGRVRLGFSARGSGRSVEPREDLTPFSAVHDYLRSDEYFHLRSRSALVEPAVIAGEMSISRPDSIGGLGTLLSDRRRVALQHEQDLLTVRAIEEATRSDLCVRELEAPDAGPYWAVGHRWVRAQDELRERLRTTRNPTDRAQFEERIRQLDTEIAWLATYFEPLPREKFQVVLRGPFAGGPYYRIRGVATPVAEANRRVASRLASRVSPVSEVRAPAPPRWLSPAKLRRSSRAEIINNLVSFPRDLLDVVRRGRSRKADSFKSRISEFSHLLGRSDSPYSALGDRGGGRSGIPLERYRGEHRYLGRIHVDDTLPDLPTDLKWGRILRGSGGSELLASFQELLQMLARQTHYTQTTLLERFSRSGWLEFLRAVSVEHPDWIRQLFEGVQRAPAFVDIRGTRVGAPADRFYDPGRTYLERLAAHPWMGRLALDTGYTTEQDILREALEVARERRGQLPRLDIGEVDSGTLLELFPRSEAAADLIISHPAALLRRTHRVEGGIPHGVKGVNPTRDAAIAALLRRASRHPDSVAFYITALERWHFNLAEDSASWSRPDSAFLRQALGALRDWQRRHFTGLTPEDRARKWVELHQSVSATDLTYGLDLEPAGGTLEERLRLVTELAELHLSYRRLVPGGDNIDGKLSRLALKILNEGSLDSLPLQVSSRALLLASKEVWSPADRLALNRIMDRELPRILSNPAEAAVWLLPERIAAIRNPQIREHLLRRQLEILFPEVAGPAGSRARDDVDVEGVRRPLRSALAHLEKAVPEPCGFRERMLNWLGHRSQTTAAEERAFARLRLTEGSLPRAREIRGVDFPHVLQGQAHTMEERLSSLRYLLGLTDRLLPPAFEARVNKRLHQVSKDMNAEVGRSDFRALETLARGYSLQSFLSVENGVMSEAGSREEIARIILGSNADEPVLRALIEAYLSAVGPTETHVLVGYLMATTGEGSGRPGEQLRRVLEAMGPFGIKVGQFLRASGMLRPELRADLDHFFSAAEPPNRAEILRRFEEVFGPEIAGRSEVGRLLGSGSLNYVVEVDLYNPESGTTESVVVRFLRERVRLQLDNESRAWGVALRSLSSHADPAVRSLARDLLEAHGYAHETLLGAEAEIRLSREPELLDAARAVYDRPVHAETGFETRSARLHEALNARVGDSHRDSVAVYERAHGVPFGDLVKSRETWPLAEQILTTELDALFLHGRFDPDGHPGNWMVDTEGRVIYRIDLSQFQQRLPRAELDSFRSVLKLLLLPRHTEDELQQLERDLMNLFEGFQPDASTRQILRAAMRARAFPSYTSPEERLFFLRSRLEAHGKSARFRRSTLSALSSLGRLRMYSERMTPRRFQDRMLAGLGLTREAIAARVLPSWVEGGLRASGVTCPGGLLLRTVEALRIAH